MRLCFVDLMPWDYDADTPYERPLGGMQSAACHLAAALARQGHEVALATRTGRPGRRRGVACLALDDPGDRDALRRATWDAVVSLTAQAGPIRALVAPGTRAFLWTGHAEDQPAVACLGDPAERRGWDGVVLVGEWQRAGYAASFGLEPGRSTVLRNAISPPFQDLFEDARDLAAAKAADGPMDLAYTSTPFRGLELLAGMFPLVARPARLRVFSDMGPYPTGPADSQFAGLYERCRSTPGIEHVGSLPQPALARALRPVPILAYPCTFPETGCIAVMEAMAAGCAVVASDLGGLAETTAGHALLVDPGEDWSSFPGRYLCALDLVMASVRSPAGIARLWEQVRFVNATATWDVRAREWTDRLAAWPQW
ncbi:glycosyltransferase [Skermanella rosea]|uniref:glycosyltransferase n=1 Tax=Skermanella rosea TaxID=1817965 RepID=UPI00193131B4|nr:glycosyltransferase [Skermanella rosea]UEM02111.1 glycosyltransferase [Skermanella rosea]